MKNPPSAAWYPDPGNPSLERWWNGVGWTEQTRPKGPPSPGQKRSGAKVALAGCGVVAVLCFFALVALTVIGFLINENEQEATTAAPETTTTSAPETTTTTAAPETTTTSAPETTTTTPAPETTITSSTTTLTEPLAMSLNAGLEFVRDQILLNGDLSLQTRQDLADSLDGRTNFIDLLSQELCGGAENADDLDEYVDFVQISELRASLQTTFSEAEVEPLLSTMSNSVLIAFCPSDFERLFNTPAR